MNCIMEICCDFIYVLEQENIMRKLHWVYEVFFHFNLAQKMQATIQIILDIQSRVGKKKKGFFPYFKKKIIIDDDLNNNF